MPDHAEPEVLSSQYVFVRARQIEGTYSADPKIGVWPITSYRVLYGWGIVPDTVWPRVSAANWPPKEPPGLDDLAKSLRILFYQRVRDLTDCERALARVQPVSAAFEITGQWFKAPRGKIEPPGPNDKIIGAHSVCLIGFNNKESEIHFVNSWGANWGDKGFGNLPYSYFDRHFLSGWVCCGPGVSRDFEYAHDINYVNLGYRAVLGKAVHVKEIYDAVNDERLGWAVAVERESHLDIEEIFVRPKHRGRGFGRQLCKMAGALSTDLNLPIRLWFSHADDVADVQRRLCKSLGLTVVPSDVRWAQFKAVCNPSLVDVNQSIPKRDKPIQWWGSR